jgi:nucleotide-binding universal stress UspA family protein
MSNDFRILVAIDLEAGTDQLLAEAQRYAHALKAVVDVIHVAQQDPDFVGYLKSNRIERPTQEDLIRDDKAKVLRSEHQQTEAIGARLRANGVRVRQTLVVQGPILGTILEHVRRLDSDLLMMGSHQHSALYRLWYGDTAAGAAKRAPCALLVVPVEPE